MLSKMTTIIGEMRVFPQRMMKNLESTHGLVYSGQLLQDVVEKGMPRDEAYKAVQENAMAAFESDTSFRERVANDARITKYLDRGRAGAYIRYESPAALCRCDFRSRLRTRIPPAKPAAKNPPRRQDRRTNLRVKTKGAIEFPRSRLFASSELGLRRAQLRRRKLKFTPQIEINRNKSPKKLFDALHVPRFRSIDADFVALIHEGRY